MLKADDKIQQSGRSRFSFTSGGLGEINTNSMSNGNCKSVKIFTLIERVPG